MTQPSSETADAAEASYNLAVVSHTHDVRVLRKRVNVESVRVPCEKPYVSNEQTVGATLRALVERAGLSQRDFAIGAGYANASSVQRYLEPSYDSPIAPRIVNNMAKALVGRGTPPIQDLEVTSLAGIMLRPVDVIEPNAVPFKMEGASAERMIDDFPIYGTALGASRIVDGEAIEQTTLNRAEVVQYIKRPVILNGRADAYGIYVQGSSMYPAHADGSVVYVEAKRPARIGDDVVVYLRTDLAEEDNGHAARAVLLKRLVRRTADYLELEQFTPARTFRIERAEVVQEHRVIPWSELLT